MTHYCSSDWPADVPLSALVNKVHCMDALELLARLPENSVNLIAVDWPYNGVKGEEWDNQWATDSDYLAWMKTHLLEMRRVLKPNGSYYGFASPRLAARVEVLTGEVFNVVNRITWRKPPYSTKAEMIDKDMMRSYFPASEAVIFAEQYGGDDFASGEAGFVEAETALKVRIFGAPIQAAMAETKTSTHELTEIIGAYGKVNHGGAVSNWLNGFNVPLPEHHRKMRGYLNAKGNKEYFPREYDDLRREYEDLRRPFNVSADVPYTDVWDFATVGTYSGKHPCEKPLAMMQYIISASSRPGDVVLDCFCGSGTTLAAAKMLGRGYIGCDRDSHWTQVAINKLVTEFGQRRKQYRPVNDLPLFTVPVAPILHHSTLSLFPAVSP